MKDIPSIRFLFKRLGGFVFVFLSLSLLSTLHPVKNVHHQFYCGVTNVMFNCLNPEIYARFGLETRTDIHHYGIAIELYDESKYSKSELRRMRYGKIRPQTTKFPDLYALVLLPSIFLISLFVATPMSLLSKIMKVVLGLLIFYLCLVFYYSYIFSLTINSGLFEFDSIWHLLIYPFGVDNAELINIFVIMIWIGLSIPQLIEKSFLMEYHSIK